MKSVDGIAKDKADAYCNIIKQSNINGKVLQNRDIQELRSVVKMNFGDWELFKMTLNAMRQNFSKVEMPEIPLHSAGGTDMQEGKIAGNHRESVIKQVAMEEEAVSGLLNFINEDAREEDEAVADIMMKTNTQEVDCIYYSNIARSIQDVDILPDPSSQRSSMAQISRITSVPKFIINGEELQDEEESLKELHPIIGHGRISPFLHRERSASRFGRFRSQSECPDLEEAIEMKPPDMRSFLNKSMTKLFENREKKENKRFYLEPSDSMTDFDHMSEKK